MPIGTNCCYTERLATNGASQTTRTALMTKKHWLLTTLDCPTLTSIAKR